jgi:hypothetical protein
MSYEHREGRDIITFENQKDYYRAMRDFCNVNILLLEYNYIIQDVNSVGDFTGFLQDRVGSYNVIDIQRGNIGNLRMGVDVAQTIDLNSVPFLYNNIFINNSETTIPEGSPVAYNPINNTVSATTISTSSIMEYYNRFINGYYFVDDNSKKIEEKKVEKKIENKDDSIKDRSELLELE